MIQWEGRTWGRNTLQSATSDVLIGQINVPILQTRVYYYYFATAALAVDSSHMTASSSTRGVDSTLCLSAMSWMMERLAADKASTLS